MEKQILFELAGHQNRLVQQQRKMKKAAAEDAAKEIAKVAELRKTYRMGADHNEN